MVRQYQVRTNSSAEFDATTATPVVQWIVQTSPVPTSTMTQTQRHGPCGQRPCPMPSPTCRRRTYTRAPRGPRRARFTLHIHPATHARAAVHEYAPCGLRLALPARSAGRCAVRPCPRASAHVRPSRPCGPAHLRRRRPLAGRPQRTSARPAALPKALESRRACTSTTLLPANLLKASRHFGSASATRRQPIIKHCRRARALACPRNLPIIAITRRAKGAR